MTAKEFRQPSAIKLRDEPQPYPWIEEHNRNYQRQSIGRRIPPAPCGERRHCREGKEDGGGSAQCRANDNQKGRAAKTVETIIDDNHHFQRPPQQRFRRDDDGIGAKRQIGAKECQMGQIGRHNEDRQ